MLPTARRPRASTSDDVAAPYVITPKSYLMPIPSEESPRIPRLTRIRDISLTVKQRLKSYYESQISYSYLGGPVFRRLYGLQDRERGSRDTVPPEYFRTWCSRPSTAADISATRFPRTRITSMHVPSMRPMPADHLAYEFGLLRQPDDLGLGEVRLRGNASTQWTTAPTSQPRRGQRHAAGAQRYGHRQHAEHLPRFLGAGDHA